MSLVESSKELQQKLLPPFSEEPSNADRQEARLYIALLLLQLSNRGRKWSSEEQLAARLDVVVSFRVVVIVSQSVEAFVEVWETADTFFDGHQTHIHHRLHVGQRHGLHHFDLIFHLFLQSNPKSEKSTASSNNSTSCDDQWQVALSIEEI